MAKKLKLTGWEILPEAGNGDRVPDPRQDSYYRPSNSNSRVAPIVTNERGTAAKPVILPDVEITAKKGEGYRNPMRHPKDIGSTPALLSAMFPIDQVMHLPSRAVNQYIAWSENKDVPFESEISQTLGWENNDPTDIWASARNIAVDNAADFILPPMAGALGHIGMVEAGNIANVASEYTNSAKNLIDITKKYAKYKPNPVEFINPAEQEMLHTVRNVGSNLTEESLKNHKSLQSVLTKAQSLSDSQFKDLTGFTRESVAGKIKKLQETEQLDKLLAERMKGLGLTDYQRPRRSLQNIEQEYRAGDFDIDNTIATGQYSSDALSQENFYNSNPTGWQTVVSEGNFRSPEISELSAQNEQRIREVNRQTLTNLRNNIQQNRYNRSNTNYNFRDLLNKNTNILDRIVEKVTNAYNNKVFYGDLPENVLKKAETKATENGTIELLPSLFAKNSTESIPRKLIQAVNTVVGSPKGTNFIGAHSLSTDSYSASLRMLKQLLDKDVVDVNFHGFKNLNPHGFAQQIGLPKQTNLKEINTLINEVNQHPNIKGKIPFAKWHKQDVYPPTLTITRKKSGGKINSWKIID